MPEVSVLVPSFNHAPYVERTLRSIFAQTLQPKKLIVIDDGSKDESPGIIARVLADCPFEHEFIKRENRGLCATLNKGFAMSDGQYFAYLGSDDLWLPEFLSESIAILEDREEAVLSFGHAYFIDENDRIVDRTDNWTPFADGDLLRVLLRGEVFSSPSVVYRRSALANHSWNEDARLEDYEMYLRLTSEGDFARCDRILSAWRLHGSNTSREYDRMFPEFIAAQNRLKDTLNISSDDLEQAQAELRFRAVAEFIRHGNRREAFSLLVKNARGAQSPLQIAKMLVRLAVPRPLFKWNRKRKREKAAEEYGKLEF